MNRLISQLVIIIFFKRDYIFLIYYTTNINKSLIIKFNKLYSKKLCYIANIYNILIQHDINDNNLQIICSEYSDQKFKINDTNNLYINNEMVRDFFNNNEYIYNDEYIFDYQNTICDKYNSRFFYFENNVFLKSKNNITFNHYIFNMNENNISLIINEINELDNFNTILFLMNCMLSYKNDQIIYCIKFIHNFNNFNNKSHYILLNSVDKTQIDLLDHSKLINIQQKIIYELCLSNINFIKTLNNKIDPNSILYDLFQIPRTYTNNIGNKSIHINPYKYLFPQLDDSVYKLFINDNLKKFLNTINTINAINTIDTIDTINTIDKNLYN